MILIRHGQTEFNRVYSETRRDPGIGDPQHRSRPQPSSSGRASSGSDEPQPADRQPLHARSRNCRDYRRRSRAADLRRAVDRRTLRLYLRHWLAIGRTSGAPARYRIRSLPDPWWPPREESVEALSRRSEIFCGRIAREAWSRIAVITHWSFIRAVAGLKVPNRAALRIDPSRPDGEAELLYVPGAG